jgi:hypothetical protein
MKIREWRNDAWVLCQKYCYPGSIPVVEKALAHGYQLGLKDATEEFRKAIDAEAERKRRSNEQR